MASSGSRSISHRCWTARLCLCAALGLALAAAHAGEQAEKALAAIKKLQASGEIAPRTSLRLTVKQGNIAAFLGRDYELQREWEKHTGIKLDTNLMPQLDSQQFIERATSIDLSLARNHELPDLLQRGLIEDLTPLMQRFGFTLPQDSRTGFLLVKQQAYVGDRIVAIPADNDVPLLYLRRDLLENPVHRARYRMQFGSELAVPKTWAEYQNQVSFFHHPQDGLYGSLEQREPHTAWMFWFPRFASFSATPFLFDEQMRPLIDSAAGVAATENYLATIPYGPPDQTKEGNDYSYTLPLFMAGKGYATIITPAGAKLFNLGTSAVKGKFITAPLPGHMHQGVLQRRSAIMYGNTLVVPRASGNKELAFLYAMWLTDPDISANSVAVPGSYADPYRYNHLRDPRIIQLYSVEALQALEAGLANVTPSGTGLPGNREYLAALNSNLMLAAHGGQTAREAMARTAREWEAITARYGREQQMRHWAAFRTLFAKP